MTEARSDLAALRMAWGSPVPDEQVAVFLALPAAKRAIAIERIASLQSLQCESRPPISVQMKEARRLGLSLQRLQALMRSWEQRSIAVVTPHGRRAPRRSQANPGRDIAVRLARKAVRRDPSLAEPTLRKRISAICTRLGISTPARMTVRRILEETRRGLPSESFEIECAAGTQSEPPRPGEVLLLTSLSFRAAIISDTRIATRAAALLLIDAGSGLVIATDESKTLSGLAKAFSEVLARGLAPLIHDWRQPNELIVAPPMPIDARKRARMEELAKRLGVKITFEQFRRGRLMLAATRWEGPSGLEIAAGNPNGAVRLDWPRISPLEFHDLLDSAVERRLITVERALDEAPYNGDAKPNTPAAISIIASLLNA